MSLTRTLVPDGNYVDRYGFIRPLNDNTSTLNDSSTIRNNAQTSSAQKRKRRENKWVHMLSNWDYFITKNQRKVRDRCRKGIPDSCRAKAWFHVSGAARWRNLNKDLYRVLIERQPDEKWDTLIGRDLHRTLPHHILFADASGPGQEGLAEILRAYSIYNPSIGYCQALAPIAAVILLYMDREEAFWTLVRMCDVYMEDYFTDKMRGIQVDALVFGELIRRFLPKEHVIIKKLSVDPLIFSQNWFFCVYTRTLPWNIVLRIWDIYFFEGKWSLFRIGLVLLKYALFPVCENPKAYDDFTVLNTIQNFDTSSLDEEAFIAKSLEYKITVEDKRRISSACSRKFDKKANERKPAKVSSLVDVQSRRKRTFLTGVHSLLKTKGGNESPSRIWSRQATTGSSGKISGNGGTGGISTPVHSFSAESVGDSAVFSGESSSQPDGSSGGTPRSNGAASANNHGSPTDSIPPVFLSPYAPPRTTSMGNEDCCHQTMQCLPEVEN